MSTEPVIDTDEHGFVTLATLDGSQVRSPLNERIPAGLPDGRNRGERRRAARLRRTARKDRARVAMFRYELEIIEIQAILEELAAEGRILKVGHDLYQALPKQPTLVDRLAERRELAFECYVAGEGER